MTETSLERNRGERLERERGERLEGSVTRSAFTCPVLPYTNQALTSADKLIVAIKRLRR